MRWATRFAKYKKKQRGKQTTPSQELNDFWKHVSSTKDTNELGRLYEQYIGYLYEDAGYEVEYMGINRGNNDCGIDLICRFEDDLHKHYKHTIIIQCKNWGNNNSISMKDLYQFFGAVCYYSAENSDEDVIGSYYTTAKFSSLARRVAGFFDIDIYENYSILMPFPVIKCKRKSGHYYLPYDWNYDAVWINPKEGDCYCLTIEEAEKKKFKR